MTTFIKELNVASTNSVKSNEWRNKMKRALIFGTMLLSLFSLLNFDIFQSGDKEQGSNFIPIGQVDLSDEYDEYDDDGDDEVGAFEKFITTHKTPFSKKIVK